LQIPLLDRLTDAEPANQREAPLTTAQGLRLLKTSLRRDIEWLLNSRRVLEEVPEWARELRRSLFAYGLYDTTGMALNHANGQGRLIALIEEAIAVFEPRLRNVQVSLANADTSARSLRLEIEGLLRVDPGPERIRFDTVLDLTSGTYMVEGNRSAG
jgi:type VI secretion system protein ImpF